MKSRSSFLLYGGIAGLAILSGAAVTFSAMASNPVSPGSPGKPALTVTVELPRQLQMPTRLHANGSVEAWQEASVGSESNGLRLAAVRANVGDRVTKGQVLAVFAPETVQAELAEITARLAESEAVAAEALANAERARALAASGALSAQQITQFTTAEKTAAARVEAQRAAARVQQLRVAKTQVLAPDDGLISARAATPGAVVPAGQELFRLIRMSRLEWRAEVTADESIRLLPGTAVSIRAADGTVLQGRVRMVAPTVDPRTRNALVYVDIPVSRLLKSGMFLSGEFELGETAAWTVPQQALVIRDGFSYVFTLNGAERVAQVKVRTGRRNGERVEVLEGVAPTTRVVAAGAGFLNDGDLVKAVKQ